MKREILCPECATKSMGVPSNATKPAWEPPDWTKRASGKATRFFQCDHCGSPIEKGDIITARTISLQNDIIDWWTGEYIDAGIEKWNPAAAEEPAPTHGKADVWPLVMEDIKARVNLGIQRYGTPLQTHNGRDALMDAYQEAIDLVMYLRQAIEERKS